MADQPKPDRGNRIILLIFIALAILTVGATIFATMNEWDTVDISPEPVTEAPAENPQDLSN